MPARFILDRFVGDDEASVLPAWNSRDITAGLSWPLFLYGPSGCGKTALAQTVAARLTEHSQRKPTTRRHLLMISGQDFKRSVNEAIATKSIAQFRTSVLASPCIIIDGLDAIGFREEIQQELVRLIDERALAARPLVLTSCAAPWCDHWNPQLVSRFSGGLSIEVKPPGSAAREHLIDLLGRRLGLSIEPSAVRFLALQWRFPLPRILRHLRELQLLSESQQNSQQPWVLRHVKELVDMRQTESGAASRLIFKAVGGRFGVAAADLRGPSRRREVVRARSMAMYLIRERVGLSFAQIGRFFGRRDASTVRHACRSIEAELNSNLSLRALADELKQTLSVRIEEMSVNGSALHKEQVV